MRAIDVIGATAVLSLILAACAKALFWPDASVFAIAAALTAGPLWARIVRGIMGD